VFNGVRPNRTGLLWIRKVQRNQWLPMYNNIYRAVDGNPDTRFAGHPPGIAYIALDLGYPCNINEIRVRFERAFAKGKGKIKLTYIDELLQAFLLQLAGDGERPESEDSRWRNVATENNGHEGWMEYKFDPPKSGRFVKVQETEVIQPKVPIQKF
jgi:hypothetical protein